MSTNLISTAEAAERLGLTVRAVQKMIEAGRLEASKVGRDYVIAPAALDNISRSPVGRKPKSQTAPKAPAVKATKKKGKK
jgi:excisionase family DNA binding protein